MLDVLLDLDRVREHRARHHVVRGHAGEGECRQGIRLQLRARAGVAGSARLRRGGFDPLDEPLGDRRRGEEVHPGHTVRCGLELRPTVSLGAGCACRDGFGVEALAQDAGARAEASDSGALGDDENLFEEHRPASGRDVAELVGDHLGVPGGDATGLE
uniref:hypothetical protein n=1 Tax=Plantibacter sp. CFBP 8775 TaxID=2774038 RepID=UPI00237BA8A3|nr:hypothetical protein [Plantibacter sp. CFBP 8775]